MDRPRSLGHIALAVGPGDGPAAAHLLSLLGLDVTDNGPSKQGDPWYTALVDADTFRGLENLFFVVPVSEEQLRLEAAIGDALVDAEELDGFFASKRAQPESASHIALAYRDLDDLEAAVQAVLDAADEPPLAGRVQVRVFRARDGYADVEERMAGSDLFADADDVAFVERTVQVFVQTDVVSTGLLLLGQTIELDYVFPALD
jgi:hypothetical protein